jgi:hypothetical protein
MRRCLPVTTLHNRFHRRPFFTRHTPYAAAHRRTVCRSHCQSRPWRLLEPTAASVGFKPKHLLDALTPPKDPRHARHCHGKSDHDQFPSLESGDPRNGLEACIRRTLPWNHVTSDDLSRGADALPHLRAASPKVRYSMAVRVRLENGQEVVEITRVTGSTAAGQTRACGSKSLRCSSRAKRSVIPAI